MKVKTRQVLRCAPFHQTKTWDSAISIKYYIVCLLPLGCVQILDCLQAVQDWWLFRKHAILQVTSSIQPIQNPYQSLPFIVSMTSQGTSFYLHGPFNLSASVFTGPWWNVPFDHCGTFPPFCWKRYEQSVIYILSQPDLLDTIWTGSWTF